MQKPPTPPDAVDAANWVIFIKEELGCESNTLLHLNPCITRVPAPLHVVSPSAFTPKTVAIGPFHRNLTREGFYAFSFAAMEEYKVEAAKILSAQSCSSFDSDAGAGFLEKLAQEIAIADQEEVRACYGREMGLAALSNEELGYMLGLDCIFIVAFMHSFYNDQDQYAAGSAWWAPSSFARVYQERFSRPLKKAVMLDLLLLENQVPLFLVKKVMQMMDGTYGEDVEESFQALVDAVAFKALPFCKEVKKVGGRYSKHLLDCLYQIVTHSMDDQNLIELHKSFHIFDPHLEDNELQHNASNHVPTATKLHQAGVQFKGHQNSLTYVNFEDKTLTLPAIHVGDETECIFRNLLAHEAQLVDRADVASYLHFMNSLINTVDDVDLLVEAGVITENIGDYKHVARLWNALATNSECIFTPQYNLVARLANNYVKEKIHGVIEEMRERYFSRPWLVLSLLSGMALLVMNFIIMWYTIKVYIKA